MKKFLLLTVLFVLSISQSSFAVINKIKELTVGKQAVSMLLDPSVNKIYVLCNGADLNFNGTFDASSNEEAMSLWSISLVDDNISKIKDLEFGYANFPSRPFLLEGGIVTTSSILLNVANKYNDDYSIKEKGFVYSLNPFNGAIKDSNYYKNNVNSIFSNNSIDIFTQKSETSDTGEVVAYNPYTYKVLNTYKAGINIMDARFYTLTNNTVKVASIANGPFSTNKSTLTLADFVDFTNVDIKEALNVGLQANHIDRFEDKLIVTAGKSQELFVVNLLTNSIEKTISIPTAKNAGLRETKFINSKYALTSSYDGLLILVDLENGNMVESVSTKYLAESILIKFPYVYVSNPINSTYEAQNIIEKFELTNLTGIDDNTNSNFDVFPNPSNGPISIINKQNFSKITLFDLKGNFVSELDKDANNFNLNQFNVSKGIYTLKFEKSDGTITSKKVIFE